MVADIAVYNAVVMTVNPDFKIIPKGVILIKGDTIADVLEWNGDIPAAAVTKDAGGGIVMPGLVNAHTHLPMTLFRGLADDMVLDDWLNRFILPAENRFIDKDNVRIGTDLALSEMISTGTTTLCDGYFLEADIAASVQSSGIRAVLGQGVIDFPAPGVPDPKENIKTAVSFVSELENFSSRIVPSIFCHSMYTCGKDTVIAVKKECDRLGILFQIHVSETRFEVENALKEHRMTPVAYLNDLGVLDENSLLAHLVWVNDNDMEILLKNKVVGVHCPESNMKLASGIAPFADFLSKGFRPALGTDGAASNNNLDMFQEMDSAAKLVKAKSLDPEAGNAETIVKAATINGARALGLDHMIGSIEPGKKADLIVINTDKPHLTPLYNPASAVVYSAVGSDVEQVMVDGVFLKEDGALKTLDVKSIMENGSTAGVKIAEAVGVKMY